VREDESPTLLHHEKKGGIEVKSSREEPDRRVEKLPGVKKEKKKGPDRGRGPPVGLDCPRGVGNIKKATGGEQGQPGFGNNETTSLTRKRSQIGPRGDKNSCG